MDVRCEKCQTEYELDESRLKPGGVTVKCTNCGHMFKIRKQLFKLSVFYVVRENNAPSVQLNFKVGIDFFNSFTNSWSY